MPAGAVAAAAAWTDHLYFNNLFLEYYLYDRELYERLDRTAIWHVGRHKGMQSGLSYMPLTRPTALRRAAQDGAPDRPALPAWLDHVQTAGQLWLPLGRHIVDDG